MSFVLRDLVGVVWYERTVFVPLHWATQRVVLYVGSANHHARVWLNGVLVDDVHTLVDAEAAKRTGEWDREASKRIIGAKRDPFFDEYRPNEVIDEYLLLLAELHPEIAEFVRAQLPFRLPSSLSLDI